MTTEERISNLEAIAVRIPVETELLKALQEIVRLKLELAAMNANIADLTRWRADNSERLNRAIPIIAMSGLRDVGPSRFQVND